ncbi:hypothetical protein LguiA_024594 [Lonicera macranthoides]
MYHSKNSLAIFEIESSPPISIQPPLISSYNDRIRPLLDAVDKLRQLKVMQEGIQLPTIVVVGDQSSGKSSVLESLAGISLPRGQGICTRVPLIMRLQHHPDPQPELHLEYNDKIVTTDESNISDAITLATAEIAGEGKGISNKPLTLVVKKNGVPDLTMVDLPGITRVPVHGQPEDIYEQISEIIMEYIKPEESIILNVLSATVDFPTCESIRMSQKVDRTGQRTLAVVTKSDKSPEGLLEKVTADDVNIGLGYVCVRNRINDESYEDARIKEAELFGTHPLLQKISKSMVGVPVLAQRLVQIQANIISKCLPDIVRQINNKLSESVSQLKKMPQHLSSVAEAMTVFMRIIGLSKESLRKIFLRGEFDEFPDENLMHGTARLAEMLNVYSTKLQKSAENGSTGKFLMEEISVLEEAKGIHLANFLSRNAFLTLLQRKVSAISEIPVKFVEDVWDYVESVVIRVLMQNCESYLQVQAFTKRAAQNLMGKMKEKSKDRVMEIVEMEKLIDYTCDLEYMSTWNELMAQKHGFEVVMNNSYASTGIRIEGFGDIEVGHLRSFPGIRDEAFDMKMRISAYWKIVVKRLVDGVVLHLMLSLQKLINGEMEKDIVNEIMSAHGGAMEWMLEESLSVTKKRERLNKRVELLKDSKEVMGNVMDRIALDD